MAAIVYSEERLIMHYAIAYLAAHQVTSQLVEKDSANTGDATVPEHSTNHFLIIE